MKKIIINELIELYDIMFNNKDFELHEYVAMLESTLKKLEGR
jgi:hypothetical protein